MLVTQPHPGSSQGARDLYGMLRLCSRDPFKLVVGDLQIGDQDRSGSLNHLGDVFFHSMLASSEFSRGFLSNQQKNRYKT